MFIESLEQVQKLVKDDDAKTIMAVWRYVHGYTGQIGYLVCINPGLCEMFDTQYACEPALIWWLGAWIGEPKHVLQF